MGYNCNNLVSIITINYNNCDGLKKTIESVINQICKDFEYIVIDGGSTDGSVDVIKEYADKITYWVSEPDKGIYNAMNKGIDVATGTYCIFMNSGDIFHNSSSIKDSIIHLDGTDIINGNTYFPHGEIKLSPPQLNRKYFYLTTIIHQSTYIKTTLLREFKYDEKYSISSDWKFWLQTLILNNNTYKRIDVFVSIFDTNGISLHNHDLMISEEASIIKELFPKDIQLEYWQEKFYHELKPSKYSKYLYILNVAILRLIAMFKRGTWIEKYPITF